MFLEGRGFLTCIFFLVSVLLPQKYLQRYQDVKILKLSDQKSCKKGLWRKEKETITSSSTIVQYLIKEKRLLRFLSDKQTTWNLKRRKFMS